MTPLNRMRESGAERGISPQVNAMMSDLIARIDAALDELKECCVQIYRLKSNLPVQEGSGFFVRDSGQHFLVSAAHVFDEAPQNERYIITEKEGLQPIRGRAMKHQCLNERDDDILDSIVVALSSFQPPKAFDLNAIDARAEYVDGFYAFMGYPGTRSGTVHGDRSKFKNRPHSYWDRSIRADAVQSFKYMDEINVLIRYQHKQVKTGVSGHPSVGVKIKGMSGGPVLYLAATDKLMSWNKGCIQLAGTVIHTVERHDYMAAVRIKHLVDALTGSSQFVSQFEMLDL